MEESTTLFVSFGRAALAFFAFVFVLPVSTSVPLATPLSQPFDRAGVLWWGVAFLLKYDGKLL